MKGRSGRIGRRGGEIGKERFRKRRGEEEGKRVNGRGERVETEGISTICLETQNS